MVKQYTGQHQVVYRGGYDGGGVFFGIRTIGPCTGKFALRPERIVAPDDAVTDDSH